MAIKLVDQYTAAFDQSFIQKVTMAIEAAAVAISFEAGPGSATPTPDHANRVALAKAIFVQPHSFATQFTLACAAQGVDTNSTDADINNSVATVWNAIAGVL